MSFATTDLCDDNAALLEDGRLIALPPVFRHYGKHARFFGPAVTLKVYEDNALVRALLETQGNCNVLVIDGGASLRRALVGGQLGLLAQNNSWGGLLIDGCIRDTDEINACRIGVRALGAIPVKSSKTGKGERDVPVQVQGVTINPGDWIYADADGILVSRQKLT